MRSALKLSVLAIVAMWAPATQAMVLSGTVTVNRVVAYSDFGSGDMIFEVSAPPTGCEGGYWLRPSDPGFQTLSALLMTVYASKLPIKVYAYDDQLWTGSASKYCRVRTIE